jgi:eukaryotic-like serine/threonine-protein kinase
MPDAAKAPAVPIPGDVIAGKYRVERVLGAGGMGIVVAATHEVTGEAVAVKVLRAGRDAKQVERFFREARTMSKLSSPHVVRVLDAGSADDAPFLVMERLDGVDLAELAKRRGTLSPREVADCILQACEALSHAHATGIVHRDVKPSNLFLHTGPDGRTVLKVLDFGISKVLSNDEFEHTLTSSTDGGVLGSPPYMSPEQVRDPKKVDGRTDVWSLGVVMYKLLSGGLPFDGESVGEVFARVLERKYPPLRLTTNVPPELDAIVGRCLEKDRRGRYAHVGELALALSALGSPEHAAMASQIAERLRDEARTVDQSSPDGLAAVASSGEPHTLTLDSPPQLPPAMTAMTAMTAMPAMPGGAVPSAHGEMGTSSEVASTSTIAPPAPARPRLALALLAVGILGGLGLGFALRPRAAEEHPSTAAGKPPAPVVEPVVAAPVPQPVVAPPLPVQSATAATTPSPAPRAGPRIGAGRKGSVLVGNQSSAATPAATGAPAAPRPELQPSPYSVP